MNNLTKIQMCHILAILISLICVQFMKISFAQNISDCSNILSYKLPNCPPGYTLTNSLCFLVSHVPTTSCPTGYQLYNNSFCYPLSALPCVPYIAPLTTTRPSYAVESETQPRCPPGSVFLQNECRKLVCSQGEYHKGRCLQAACANGKVWRGRRCQDPEYVTTIIEIENVFTDSKQRNLDNLDVQIITGPPLTDPTKIKTYFNKTVDNQGTINVDKNLDIELQTNSPTVIALENLDVQIIKGTREIEPTKIKTYFNKTIINRDTKNYQNLDIEIITDSPADNLLAREKTDIENDNNLNVVSTTKTPNSNMNSVVVNNTDIYFNKTNLNAITSYSTVLKNNLDVQVIVGEPHSNLSFQADAKNTLFFNKTIISEAVNQTNVLNNLDNAEITTTTNKFDKPFVSGTTENSAATTFKTNIINSTAFLTAPSTNNTNNNCCSVYTPRICKKYGERWLCFNRSYKICDVRVCTHDVIYLKSPEITYKAPLLIMPPNPPLSACASSDCDNKKIPNCAGCTSYQAETCSFYCYRYLCPQDSCNYMDQQLFCTYYPGEFGCRERDGCVWNWCEHS